MTLPDRVIVFSPDGTSAIGYTSPIFGEEVVRVVSDKAVALLCRRSYESFDKNLAKAIFGRSAFEDVSAIIRDDQQMFEERKIVQFYQVKSFRTEVDPDKETAAVYVKGFLFRYSFLLGLETPQKFKFDLAMRLVRANNLTDYPLRVLRLRYRIEEIVDNESVKKEFTGEL